MKDKNGIDICCKNCDKDAQRHCVNWNPKNGKEGSEYCVNDYFSPSFKALEARIAELESKLTETVKLLSERSRECGKLQALLEIKNKSNMSTQSTDCVKTRKEETFTKDEANWILNLLVSEYTDEPQCESIIAKCEQILGTKD